MKKVSFYLLGLVLLTITLISFNLKELFGASMVEKNKIDHQISSAVCDAFINISTDHSSEVDVMNCADLGNGSFQLMTNTNNGQLDKIMDQHLIMEDNISYPFQISLKNSITKNDTTQSIQSDDGFQTAFVNIDVPSLHNIMLNNWGSEIILMIIILSLMIWIYYNIIRLLCNYKSYSIASEVDNFQIGNYFFDVRNQALGINDKHWRITTKECQVLNYLYNNKNQITRREDILMALWGENDYFNGRSLDVFIARLRKHLSEDDAIKIETVHGVGFILTDK